MEIPSLSGNTFSYLKFVLHRTQEYFASIRWPVLWWEEIGQLAERAGRFSNVRSERKSAQAGLEFTVTTLEKDSWAIALS